MDYLKAFAVGLARTAEDVAGDGDVEKHCVVGNDSLYSRAAAAVKTVAGDVDRVAVALGGKDKSAASVPLNTVAGHGNGCKALAASEAAVAVARKLVVKDEGIPTVHIKSCTAVCHEQAVTDYVAPDP